MSKFLHTDAKAIAILRFSPKTAGLKMPRITLPFDKFLALFKLKVYADDKFSAAQMKRFSFEEV